MGVSEKRQDFHFGVEYPFKGVIMRNNIVFDYLRKKVKMFWHGNFTNKCTLENNIIIINLQDKFTCSKVCVIFLLFFLSLLCLQRVHLFDKIL